MRLQTQPNRQLHLKIILICAGLFSFLTGRASEIQVSPSFTNFGVDQGLPSSETYYVHQDRTGYIWICTDLGVARYDGYRFRVFTKKDGLTDNVVFKIHEDKAGRLWFITYNGMLCYWDGQVIRPYRYNHLLKAYLKGDIATYKTFDLADDGTVYYGTLTNGLVRISPKGKMVQERDTFVNGKPVNQVRKLARKWGVISNRHILKKHSPLMGVVFYVPGKKTQYLLSNTLAMHAYTTSGPGYAFAQLNNTVHDIYHPERKEQLYKLVSMHSDGKRLFFGTADGCIVKRLDQFGTNKMEMHFLNGHTVSWSMRDREGGYWFSTTDAGVFYTPTIYVNTYDLTGVLRNQNVDYVWGYDNRLFYASTTDYYAMNEPFHLQKWDVSNSCVVRLGGSTLFSSVNRDLWMVDYFPESPHSVLLAEKGISRLHEDGSRTLLYHAFHKATGRKRSYFRGIVKDDRGRILAGSVGGIFQLMQNRIEQYPFRDSLFKCAVTDMDFDPEWGVIVCTKENGLYCFNGTQITHRLLLTERGRTVRINKLCRDRLNRLWLSTNAGVYKVRKLPNGKLVTDRFTRQMGLPSDEINAVYLRNDSLWVATQRGLAVIRINQLTPVHNAKPPVMETMITNEGVFRSGMPVKLSSSVHFVRILLRSDNFRTGKNRRIRYRFVPGETWLNTRQGEILLTSPKGGDYQLQVSAMNEAGQWSPPAIVCRFTVLPPFYATWYFITAVIMLVICVMFLLFRMRLKRVRQRHQLHDTINQLEQKALRAQMNPHFIFNSLNSIQSFLVYEENEKAERYLLKFAQLIRLTLNNSRETYIPVESEIDSLKRYLELEQMRFKDKFSFEVDNRLSEEDLRYGVPPMLIQPFVENAVLHGFKTIHTGGKILLTFRMIKDNGLECSVEDNGVGRKATMGKKSIDHKSFGTRITEERLRAFRQKYGDDFRVEMVDKEVDGQPAGTLVKLRIPVMPAGTWRTLHEDE